MKAARETQSMINLEKSGWSLYLAAIIEVALKGLHFPLVSLMRVALIKWRQDLAVSSS